MSGTDAEIPPRTAAADTAKDPTAAQTTTAELISTDEFSQYLLRAKSEMFAVFRGLVEAQHCRDAGITAFQAFHPVGSLVLAQPRCNAFAQGRPVGVPVLV